jgi:ribosomal protein S18 acetylase RimI-like enzyme
MKKLIVSQATNKDRNQLYDSFKHYKIKEIIENRVDCCLSHNFTVVAKGEDKIIGKLQWIIKEDPNAGVVEFEEMFVSEEYRRKSIGSLILKYAIQSVIQNFKKINIKPRKIFLFVGKNNRAARDLYEKHGFKKVSEVGYLFSNKEIELFYSLDLE